MGNRYILNGKKPVPCEDLMKWGRWYETAERHVAETLLSNGVHVSTVFLGLDHRFDDGPPLLFETMIFGTTGVEMWCERCSTWEEAEAMHERALKLAESDG